MKFEQSLSVLAELDDFTAQETRKLALAIDRRVVQETPFDEGTAKRSWLVSVDQVDNRIVDAGGVDLSTAEMQAIEQGAAEIRGAKVFTRIFIQNNQPYIERLNEGWSAQAPTKYVDTIIAQEVAR